MAFDTSKRAIADQNVVLRFSIPRRRSFIERSCKLRFGIAAADWQIPEHLRLGIYRIEARFGEGRYEDSGASASVKISRYELHIQCNGQTRSNHYLPNQNASIEIHADYLFGEPVRHGHVRLVRETERQWNYANRNGYRRGRNVRGRYERARALCGQSPIWQRT